METNSEQRNKKYVSFEEELKQDRLYNVRAIMFNLESVLTALLGVHTQCPHCGRPTFETESQVEANAANSQAENKPQ